MPPQRNIDTSDRAFNAVLEPPRFQVNESVVAALASALQAEPAEAQAMIDAGKPVPLARSQTRAEAEMIAGLVRTCGLRASVIADEELRIEDELLRARRIALGEQELRVYHSAGEVTVTKPEVRLLVLGMLRSARVDYTEGISGARGPSGAVLDSSEFSSEETLLDVYTTELNTSFRIKSDAFDYSGLVLPLSFRADMNFKSAVAILRAALPEAPMDDEFPRMSRLLDRAWPARTRNESRGFKRTGLAFRAVAQASAISDNRDQFERYSRMMFLFSQR